MNILENISDMLALNLYEFKSFKETCDSFIDKYLSSDDIDTEFKNYCDLLELIDITRSISFSAGFKTATQLLFEGMKELL